MPITSARQLKRDRLLLQARQAEAAGKPEAQFDRLLAAVARLPGDTVVQAAMAAHLTAYGARARHPDLDTMWCLALDQAWARPTCLAPAAMRYVGDDPVLARALALTTQDHDVLHAASYYLERHPVFHVLARVALLASPAWQSLLARLRDHLLAQRCLHHAEPPLQLALALALQHDLTEGIEPPSRAALAQAHDLESACLQRLQAGMPVPAADVALSLSALAVDESVLAPLLMAPFAHRQWPALGPLLQLPAQRRQEAMLQRQLLAGLRDAAADPVREQYEAHPYPRWTREPLGQPPALAPAVSRRLNTLAAAGAMQVLVAGCGTGQQVFVARSRYPRAHLVAVDFSVPSLAHAMRKCAEADVVDIEFHALDLLTIASLGTRYHAIDCVGVLQHLSDPEQGLAALAAVLRPQGLLYLTVYGPHGREGIAALRDRIRQAGIGHTPSEVRAFRRRLLDERPCRVPPAVASLPDFHVTSGVRDLLFHAREVALPLDTWGAMALRQGLDLIHLEAPPEAIAQAGRRFRRDPARITAAQWASVEQTHPDTFGGVYRMWLVRR